MYAPYEDKGIIALALDNRDDYHAENEALLAQLKEAFIVKRCPLGEDPHELLPPLIGGSAMQSVKKRGALLLTLIEKEGLKRDSIVTNRIVAVGLKNSEGAAKIVEHLAEIGVLLLHKKRKVDQLAFPVRALQVVVPAQIPEGVVRYPNDKELYILLELDAADEGLTAVLDVTKLNPDYDASYARIDELLVE